MEAPISPDPDNEVPGHITTSVHREEGWWGGGGLIRIASSTSM